MKFPRLHFTLLMLIFFMLGFMLIIPFFDRRSFASARDATYYYDTLEAGWGNWNDGGTDCARYTGGTYAHEGYCAIDIQDNSGYPESATYSKVILADTNGYDTMTIDFWWRAVSMENQEDFWVDYYDGTASHRLATIVIGTGTYSNNIFYHTAVTISEDDYTFSDTARFRIQCDASDDVDDVYIDQIYINVSRRMWIPSMVEGYFTFKNTDYTPVYDNMSQGYFTFENTSSWQGSDGFFTFANSPSWTGADGYFTFGNTTGWQEETSGYFTFGNITTDYQTFDEGYFTFANSPTWTGTDGYFTFGNLPSWQGAEGYFTFGNLTNWQDTHGWFTFGNGAWQNITQGWFTFSSARIWDSLSEGYFTFGNTPMWANASDGYFTFGNQSLWTNLSQGYFTFRNGLWQNMDSGYFTFGNQTLWSNMSQGYFTFGNNQYMIIVSVFPDNGSLICPTCYENDTFFYFYATVDHHNGTLMDIEWTTWNGTLLGQLNNVGNGTYHIIPFENVMNMTYDTTYNYTINVSDGGSWIERTIIFRTDTEVNCMQFLWNVDQFGLLLTFIVFAFFFLIGYRSEKRSGGFFLILSGFTFMAFAIASAPYLSLLIVGLLIPFGIFICLLGVKKAFYNDEAKAKELDKALEDHQKRRKR